MVLSRLWCIKFIVDFLISAQLANITLLQIAANNITAVLAKACKDCYNFTLGQVLCFCNINSNNGYYYFTESY